MRASAYVYRAEVDGEGGHRGYQVRFMSHTDTPINKFFGDARYGGKRGAFRAAVAFRDKTMKTVPARYTNGKKGPLGVCFGKGICRVERVKNGVVYSSYVAYSQNKGKRRQREWSIDSHGEERARKCAIRWREAQTEGMFQGKVTK